MILHTNVSPEFHEDLLPSSPTTQILITTCGFAHQIIKALFVSNKVQTSCQIKNPYYHACQRSPE